MRNIVWIMAALMFAGTGCVSKADQGEAKIPDAISKSQFSVMQHYGKPLEGGFPLDTFIMAFQKYVGPSAKITWKTGDNQTWTMNFERYDDASRRKIRMAWVFEKIGKQAVVTRMTLDEEEIPGGQLGTVMNQFTYPVYTSMPGAKETPARLPASQ